MIHPATAPTLPCPAKWPATPPTIAPLIHPFASAAAGANARPRIAVQKISSFMAALRKKLRRNNVGCGDWFRKSIIFPRQDYFAGRPTAVRWRYRQSPPNLQENTRAKPMRARDDRDVT